MLKGIYSRIINVKELKRLFSYDDNFQLLRKTPKNKTVLIPVTSSKGYPSFTPRTHEVYLTGLNRYVLVHKVIYILNKYRNSRLVFILEPEVVSHINGDILDNNPSNLMEQTYPESTSIYNYPFSVYNTEKGGVFVSYLYNYSDSKFQSTFKIRNKESLETLAKRIRDTTYYEKYAYNRIKRNAFIEATLSEDKLKKFRIFLEAQRKYCLNREREIDERLIRDELIYNLFLDLGSFSLINDELVDFGYPPLGLTTIRYITSYQRFLNSIPKSFIDRLNKDSGYIQEVVNLNDFRL
jgi:hypothetical protein